MAEGKPVADELSVSKKRLIASGAGVAASAAVVTALLWPKDVATNWSLAWDYATNKPMAFEVQSSVDLVTWSKFLTVTNVHRAPMWTTNQQQFYRVRALDPATGIYSDWAGK